MQHSGQPNDLVTGFDFHHLPAQHRPAAGWNFIHPFEFGCRFQEVQRNSFLPRDHPYPRQADARFEPPANYALTIPPLNGELGSGSTFAAPVGTDQGNLLRVNDLICTDHFIPHRQLHSVHASGDQPHGAHFLFLEADAHSFTCRQEDIRLALCDKCPAQRISLINFAQGESLRGRSGQFADGCLLDHPTPGNGHDKTVRGDLVLGRQAEHRSEQVIICQRRNLIEGDSLLNLCSFGNGMHRNGCRLPCGAHQIQRLMRIRLDHPQRRILAAQPTRRLMVGSCNITRLVDPHPNGLGWRYIRDRQHF